MSKHVRICTRKHFMKRLEQVLLWRYNKNEIVDILKDYEEYFEIGLERGRAERELCMELGDPELIVNELDIEFCRNARWNNFSNKMIIRSTIVFLLVCFCCYYVANINYNSYMKRDSSIWVVTLSIGTWLLLGGRFFSLFSFGEKTGKNNLRRCIILNLVVMFIMLMMIYFEKILFTKLVLERKNLFHLELYEIGPFVSNIVSIIILLMIGICIYAIYAFRQYEVCYYTIFCNSIGGIGSLFCYLNLLHCLDNPDSYVKSVMECILPYVIGVTIAVSFLIYSQITSKGGN